MKTPVTHKSFGLIFNPMNKINWAAHSCLTPTPFLINSNTIRVFVGLIDSEGISRIGFVDVLSSDPRIILDVSPTPIVEIGIPGTFDDNGMMPCEIIKVRDEIFLFYIGFQKVEKIKFQAFTGILKSTDGGNTFERMQNTPILERSEEGLFIKTLHTLIHENGRYMAWYVGGSGWSQIGNNNYANYEIYFSESDSIFTLPNAISPCLTCNVENNEYRIGRPRVRRIFDYYEMTFTYSKLDGTIKSGYATSKDGLKWLRDDSLFPILPSSEWNSNGINVPYAIDVNDRHFVFFNGNQNGFDGFGCTEITYK